MLKRLVGLAAVGGFLYAHKRRGGQLTLESFKQTARSLVDDVKARARELKASAEQKLAEQREQELGTTRGAADQSTGYGSPGYSYGSGDINRDINRR